VKAKAVTYTFKIDIIITNTEIVISGGEGVYNFWIRKTAVGFLKD
jgi:hypothetical protein